MDYFEKEYLTSIIGSLFLAHFYGLLEHWMNWTKVHEFFAAFPSWHGVTAYQYLFMFPLFFFIGGLPLIDDILFRRVSLSRRIRNIVMFFGNCMLAGLFQDSSYYYLYGTWTQPCHWNTHVIGYVQVFGVTIPNYYFLLVCGIVLCYTYSFKLGKRFE